MHFFQVGGQNPRFRVTLQKGSTHGEEISLVATYENEQGKRIRKLKSGILIPGEREVIEWDTVDALKKEELSCQFNVELVLGNVAKKEDFKTRKVERNYRGIVVYKPTIEITAVDTRGQPVPDAACKISILEDPEFDPAGLYLLDPTDPPGPNGEKVWRSRTNQQGVVTFPGLRNGKVEIEWEQPHMLTSKGWLTEGEFTPTGAKRKAEIRKLPVVNYIWWGNPTKDEHLKSATATPNDMARLQYKGSPGVLVNVWCQDNAVTLHGKLDPAVSIHKLTSLSDLMKDGDFAIHSVFMGRGILLDSILGTLGSYRLLSAAKDLLSLCIMYKYGGYYFDTTTIVPVDQSDALCETLENTPPEIRFPSTAGGAGSYSFYRHDSSAFATVFANTNKLQESGKFWTANLDVWALYTPPRHPGLAMMIDSYINRCVDLGLDSHPNNKVLDFGANSTINRGEKWVWKDEWNGRTFHDFVTNVCKPDVDKDPATSARNNIIGNLIITSVQEGLNNYLFEYQDKPIPGEQGVKDEVSRYLWKTDYASSELKAKYSPAKVQASIPEICNMPKAHSGSWRKS